MTSVPFSCGSICRLWLCVVVVRQRVQEEDMEQHSSLGEDAHRPVGDGRHRVALAEEVVQDRAAEDMHSLDAQGPFIIHVSCMVEVLVTV